MACLPSSTRNGCSLVDELLEDARDRQRLDHGVGLHEDGAVGAHRERRAQLLLRVAGTDADGEHLVGLAALLDAQRLLERDLVERIDAHLDAVGDHAVLSGLTRTRTL